MTCCCQVCLSMLPCSTSRMFAALTMGNNDFSGPLYNLRNTSMVSTGLGHTCLMWTDSSFTSLLVNVQVLLETSNNTGLCGMVRGGARQAAAGGEQSPDDLTW